MGGGGGPVIPNFGQGDSCVTGDHTFFIADVLSIEHGPSSKALVYRESTYHSV